MQQRIKDSNQYETNINEANINEPNINEANTHEPNINEANTHEPNTRKSNTKESKLNRRKTSYVKEKSETYDLVSISERANEAMQHDINDTPDKKSAKADCLLPDPTDVATMMKRIYQTEFPHVDIDTVFVSG